LRRHPFHAFDDLPDAKPVPEAESLSGLPRPEKGRNDGGAFLFRASVSWSIFRFPSTSAFRVNIFVEEKRPEKPPNVTKLSQYSENFRF